MGSTEGSLEPRSERAHRDHPFLQRPPTLQITRATNGSLGVAPTGAWTTLVLAPCAAHLEAQLARYGRAADVSWDLSRLDALDHTGAALLWQAWGRSLPRDLLIPTSLRSDFAPLQAQTAVDTPARDRTPSLTRGVERLGEGLIDLFAQLRDAIELVGQLLLDLADLARRPAHWPMREISAGIFRAGAQALGILAMLGFLTGVVLSYLAGDQLRQLGAEIYVVNLLGIGCVRELGPLLTAILVAGRSGSSITAQLGVMRLNEELDALTTMGIATSQRLILPKVLALSISQPLAGLWTSAAALAGGMVAAHFSLGIGYAYFLDALPGVVPIANYWVAVCKGVVFGVIIALVACFFGLRVKPNTESLGAGTTNSVVVAISGVLTADAVFAVLFSQLGI